MKKIILSLLTATALIFGANAATITVSNNVYSPGQYEDLQEAINASQPNDTILVAGSSTSYGVVEISWPLTLLGAGYNNAYGENSSVDYLYFKRANASIGASGSRISGFNISASLRFEPYFNGGTVLSQHLENIIVERCQLSQITTTNNVSFSNISIRNCLLKNSGIYFGSSNQFNNFSFFNNVIENYQITKGDNQTGVGIKIRNNVFLNCNSNVFIMSNTNPYDGFVVENNIFYGVWASGCYNCTFNNNLTFQCNEDELLNSGNPGSVGSGNIIGQNPNFENYPILGGTFLYTHDLHLKSTSPGKNAGTDGSDIGMYGGLLPFEQVGKNPNIPQMEYISFPDNSSAPVGGSLNVDFKSHRQD